jgi:hypothetical protein
VATRVLLEERGEGVLGLGADAGRDAGRDHVEDDDPRVVAPGKCVGELQGELGVGAATDRDEDPLDLVEGALLDDRDVARRVADDRINRGREDGAVRGAATAGAPAPAEDEQVGVHLVRRLDDPLCRPAPDPDQRPDPCSLRGVVEDLLEQAPRLPRQRRAVRERNVLGDLHDAENGQLAGPRIHDLRTDPHEVFGRGRVGDGDEDPGGERRPRAHAPAPSAARQRSTR